MTNTLPGLIASYMNARLVFRDQKRGRGGSKMKRKYFSPLGAFVGFAALLCGPSAALAQVAPPLGILQQFSVLGGSAATGSAGAGTVVAGDVGSNPTDTVNNFPPSSVTAGFFVRRVALGDGALLLQARTDATAAFLALSQVPTATLASNLNGQILTSGVYDFVGGFADLPALGTLTLNGGGIFVFRTGSTVVFNVGSTVMGTANPCNVFWQVGSSATLNGNNFFGQVFASASITVGASNVTGRTIAGTGFVTMSNAGNTIGGCATPGFGPPPPPPPVPALPEVATWALLAVLLTSGVFILSRR